MNSPEFRSRIRSLEHLYPSRQKLGLDNILALLNKLDNPQHRLPPVIHMAGTNGKGSTQAVLRSILMAAGYRVHAYTSPHLIDFTERIILDGQQITESQFLHYLDTALNLRGNNPISWFELITAVAFQSFADIPGDVVLLETGMGGRLDATNVISLPVCTIITSISLDHQQALGHSLAKIAAEKAGIIKPDVPLITCRQSPDVLEVISSKAKATRSPLFLQSVSWDYRLDHQSLDYPFLYCFQDQIDHYKAPALSGLHQLENASLALTALHVLKPIFPMTSENINTGLMNIHWPGRLQNLRQHPWQQLLPASTQLYLDGAHNLGGITAVIDFIKATTAEQTPPTLIFGALRRKNLIDLITPFKGHVEQMIGVTIDGEDAYTASDIANTAIEMGIVSQSASSVPHALQIAASQQLVPQMIIICGSLYLVGRVLAADTVRSA